MLLTVLLSGLFLSSSLASGIHKGRGGPKRLGKAAIIEPGPAGPASPSARSRPQDGCVVQSCAVTDQTGDAQSKLSVCFELKKGKLFVPRGRSTLKLSNTFTQPPAPSAGQAEKTLLDDLNWAFTQLDYFDRYAMPDVDPPKEPTPPDEPEADASEEDKQAYEDAKKEYDEQKKEYDKKKALYDKLQAVRTKKLEDPVLSGKVRGFTGSWTKFREEFNKWKEAMENDAELRQAFADYGADFFVFAAEEAFGQLESQLAEKVDGTALIYDAQNEDGLPNSDTANATLCFRVTDPVRDYTVVPAGEEKFVKATLGGLRGKLWRPTEINNYLTEFYQRRGYSITFVKPDGLNQVKLRRWRVAKIFMPKGGDKEDVPYERILQVMLPHKALKDFYANRLSSAPDPTKDLQEFSGEGVAPNQVFLDYGQLVGDSDDVYYNRIRLQRQNAGLGKFGYQVVEDNRQDSEADQATYIDLVVFKKVDQDKKDDTNSPAPGGGANGSQPGAALPDGQSSSAAGSQVGAIAPAVGTPSGSFSRPSFATAAIPATLPTPTPTPDDAQGSAEKKEKKNHKNFAGIELRYKPDQGVRVFGVYKRKLNDNNQLSFRLGAHSEALGEGSYTGNFRLPFFGSGPGGKIRRPFTFEITGTSEFEARRVFNGLKTDERRKGGQMRGTLAMFDEFSPHQLDIYVAALHQTVELVRDDQSLGKQNITALDLGFIYRLDGSTRQTPSRLSFQPQVRLGLGLGEQEPRFTVFTLTGNWHRELSRRFQLDLGGRAEAASSNTPIFEQPSFGSAETVRGFRRDDAIGRRLWSLQPELWLPLNGFTKPSARPAAAAAGGSGKLDDLKNMIYQNLSFAAFFDVGGIYRTTGATAGTRGGPGVGLRLNLGNQGTFKLDWAYGLGDGVTGRGHGRIYFTMKTDLGF